MDQRKARDAAISTMGTMFLLGLVIFAIKLMYDNSPELLLGMIVTTVVYLVLYGFFRTKFGAKVYNFLGGK